MPKVAAQVKSSKMASYGLMTTTISKSYFSGGNNSCSSSGGCGIGIRRSSSSSSSSICCSISAGTTTNKTYSSSRRLIQQRQPLGISRVLVKDDTQQQQQLNLDLETSSGGGGFGNDKGGGGGGGGGDGDSGDINEEDESSNNNKKTGMSMSQKLTLGYALLVGVGGVMGYVKSGSQKSLAAGGLSALLLFYVYTQLPVRPALASSLGFGLSAALLGVMGSRFKRSGKVFPAGVVSFVSLIMTGGYLHGIMRGSHA